MRVWQNTRVILGRFDEMFWHATTFTNVMKIKTAPAIKPDLGTGANGPGFYVCPRITDYQKVMARRIWKLVDGDFLYILRILVKNFYKMTPFFSDGLAGAVGHDVGDFVASRWASHKIAGQYGCLGPSENKKPNNEYGYYDQYQGKELSTPGWDRTKDNYDFLVGTKYSDKSIYRKNLLNKLWKITTEGPNAIGNTESIKLNNYITEHGARKTLLDTIEEITFKNSAASKICVIGVNVFSPNSMVEFENDTNIPMDHIRKRAVGG